MSAPPREISLKGRNVCVGRGGQSSPHPLYLPNVELMITAQATPSQPTLRTSHIVLIVGSTNISLTNVTCENLANSTPE